MKTYIRKLVIGFKVPTNLEIVKATLSSTVAIHRRLIHQFRLLCVNLHGLGSNDNRMNVSKKSYVCYSKLPKRRGTFASFLDFRKWKAKKKVHINSFTMCILYSGRVICRVSAFRAIRLLVASERRMKFGSSDWVAPRRTKVFKVLTPVLKN